MTRPTPEPDDESDAATPVLYICASLPDRWVTEDHGALVHWPAIDGGWEQRAPYRGHRRALRKVDPAAARGTGWPGAGTGRRRLGGSEAGKNMTIRLAPTTRAALEALAAKQGQKVSDAAREAIEMAIARGSTR